MKTVSENIKNALKQPTTQRKGKILVSGNYYEVYNVEYYADAYNEGNVIGLLIFGCAGSSLLFGLLTAAASLVVEHRL